MEMAHITHSAAQVHTDSHKSFPMYIPSSELIDNVLSCGGFGSLVAEWLVDRLSNTSNPCFCCIQEDFHPFDSNKEGEC